MTSRTISNPQPASRWLVTLLVVVPVVAIFAPVLFADRSFAFRDGAHFYHPQFEWISGEWGAGRVPLWNPQENCGLPVLADATSSIFYPGKLIFALPLPFSWRYKLYVIGHVLLAAGTMYLLARRLKASQPGAALAAIAYACGGNVVFQYCNIVFLVGAAWLPAALLAIEVIVASRCWRAMIGLAIVLAMMILGGDPQMAYHALLAAGLRLVCAWLGKTAIKGEFKQSSLLPGTLLLGGAACLAFLLASVQILPSSESTKSSERAAYKRPRNVYEAAAVIAKSGANDSLLAETPSEAITAGIFGKPEPTSHHDRAYNFSISPWRMVEFVWPNISGRIFPTNRRWASQLPGDWTPTMYLGLLPLLVGVVALRWWRTDATTRWLSWLVLIFALGSLGWYGLGWLLREFYVTFLRGDASNVTIGPSVGGVYWLMVTLLPTYVYFRYPAKLMVVAVCALCAVASLSTDRLFATRSQRWLTTLKWLSIGSGALAFVVWCASSYLLTVKTRPSAVFGPFDTRGAIVDVISALLHAAIVAWSLQWLLTKIWDATGANKSNQEVARWQWAAIALTALELVIANSWLIVSAPASMWQEVGPVAQLVQQPEHDQQPRFFRGSYQTWHPASFGKASSPSRPQEQARWEHDTLFPKYHLPSGLPLVESYGSLKSLDYESLMHVARVISQTKVDGVPVPVPGALRLSACEYLILPASAQIPFADKITPPPAITLPENVSVWRMKRTLPRAWVVHRVVQLLPLANSLDIDAVDARAKEVLTEQRDGKLVVRDFRTVAVVETAEQLSAELLQPNASEGLTAPCSIIINGPQHMRISAQLSQPGLLVLADSWGSGWTAWLQPADTALASKPAKRQELVIHRTNRCFRGVELPAGEWLVDFEYRPNSFYRGGLISSVAWLAILLTGCIVWIRRRTPA